MCGTLYREHFVQCGHVVRCPRPCEVAIPVHATDPRLEVKLEGSWFRCCTGWETQCPKTGDYPIIEREEGVCIPCYRQQLERRAAAKFSADKEELRKQRNRKRDDEAKKKREAEIAVLYKGLLAE